MEMELRVPAPGGQMDPRLARELPRGIIRERQVPKARPPRPREEPRAEAPAHHRAAVRRVRVAEGLPQIQEGPPPPGVGPNDLEASPPVVFFRPCEGLLRPGS